VAPLVKRFKQKKKGSAVWMPFYYDGQCGNYLTELGFQNVVHEEKDFFERIKDKKFMDTVGLVWDNPPYTGAGIKEQILSVLHDSGKPFVLLLPSSVLFSKLVRDTLDMDHVQVVMPRKVMVRKTNQAPVPFKHLVWLCYRLNMDKDLVFV
jgi:hypothetical protein